MKISVFEISRLSTTVALIITSGVIVIKKGLKEGLGFLTAGLIVLVTLWYLECFWIEYKHNKGIN